MHHLTRIATALAVAGVLALAAPATAAAPTIELRPGALPRGADTTIVHLEGHHRIVDGDRGVRTDARLVSVLGASGRAWIASAATRTGTKPRLLRVRPDGSTRVLMRGPASYEAHLSDDGERVFSIRTARFGVSSRVRVIDARTAHLDADRTFTGSVGLLEALGNRALMSGNDRTFRWNIASDATRRIADRQGYEASTADDRLATFTRDPYEGGCTVVSLLSDPSEVLWRSCDEGVTDFADGGQRMATIPILTDGLGPASVTVRKIHGRKVATFTARWFSEIAWEDDTALAMYVNGKKQSAWVRCTEATCLRAGPLRPVQEP
jgi:hypothetical protein